MTQSFPLSRGAFGSMDALCAELRRRALGGQSCVVTDVDALSPEEARQLLDLMLHDPDIDTPFEPFGSLLSAMIQKRPLGLWDLPEFENVNGEAHLRRLPMAHPECLSCGCFPICEGYGSMAGSCETWRVIIVGLAEAARQLVALQGEKRKAPGSPEAFPL